MNRSKAKGTAVETAFTRFAQSYGFPYAMRRTLGGAIDKGDVLLTRDKAGSVIAECKGGAAAELASEALIRAWLEETERERVNAGADVALLVVKRRGVGHARAHQWSAFLPLWALATTLTERAAYAGPDAHVPVRMTVEGALTVLRAHGWGERLA